MGNCVCSLLAAAATLGLLLLPATLGLESTATLLTTSASASHERLLFQILISNGGHRCTTIVSQPLVMGGERIRPGRQCLLAAMSASESKTCNSLRSLLRKR